MKNRFFPGVYVVLCVFLAACQTVNLNNEPRIEVEHILLLPTSALHQEMSASLVDVDVQLHKALSQAGYQVSVMDTETLQPLKEQALEVSGAVYNPDIGQFIPLNKKAYYKALGQQLIKQQVYDLLLVPELVLRSADVQDMAVSWDGRQQKLELEGYDVGLPAPSRAKGLSLRLSSYSNTGQVFTDAFYGLSLPYSIHYHAGEPVFQLKPVFFTSTELDKTVSDAVKSLTRRTL